VCRHTIHDYADNNPENLKVIVRDPKSITIEPSPEAGTQNYHMEIDPWLQNKIRSNDQYIVATTPWSMLQAVSRGQKYKFHKDYIFHLKEGCIPGIKLYGWGLPSILSAFQDFFRIQILRKYDQTLVLDYIIPMRILSPARGSVSSDGNSIICQRMSPVWRPRF